MPKNTEAPIEALRLGFISGRGGLSVQSRELAKRKDIGNPMSFLFEEGYEVILFELFILVASQNNKGKFTGEESNLKVKDARFSGPSKLAHAFLRMQLVLQYRLLFSQGSGMQRRNISLHLLRTFDQQHVPSTWSTSMREEHS